MQDSILFCLQYFANWLHSPLSGQSLSHGIPLEKGKVGVSSLPIILNKLGYEGKIVPYDQITSPLTNFAPFFVINGEECLCVSVIDNQKVEGAFSHQPDISWMSLEDFQNLLTPDSIIVFTKPKSKFHMHWLWGTLIHYKSTYKKVILAGFITNILSILIPLYTMNVYDRVIPNASYTTLEVLTFGVITVIIVDFILRFLKTYFIDIIGKNSDTLLSSKLIERVLGVNFDKLTLSSGTLLNHIRELEMLREFFSSTTLTMLIDLPFSFIFLAAVFIVGGSWLALVCIVTILLIIISSRILQAILEKYTHDLMEGGNIKHNFLIELVLGLENIKAHMAEGRMQRIWNRVASDHALHTKNISFFSSAVLNLTSFWQSLNYVILVVVGVILIINNQLTMGGLIACSILSGRILAPFIQVMGIIGKINHIAHAYTIIDGLMKLPLERQDEQVYISRPHLTGSFIFDNVSFTYPQQDRPSLNNISFEVKPGDKVAILGRIGSGKTTLEKLLLGLYHPTQGKIIIDGVDSRQIDPADLRTNIAYVPQDATIFNGTVFDNILLTDQPISPERLEQAVLVSGVHEFVKLHPKGLGMPVGEGGKWLSGGQKQAIILARALIKNAPILLMDEPSSMLDHVNEKRLLDYLQSNCQNKTLFVISHNLHFLPVVTKVAVIHDSRITFFGEKEEFIKKFLSKSSPEKGEAS